MKKVDDDGGKRSEIFPRNLMLKGEGKRSRRTGREKSSVKNG